MERASYRDKAIASETKAAEFAATNRAILQQLAERKQYNTRIVNQHWRYDKDGRVIQSVHPDEYGSNTYDARGLSAKQLINGQSEIDRFYNGDGREVKQKKRIWTRPKSRPIARFCSNTLKQAGRAIGRQLLTARFRRRRGNTKVH